MDAVSQVLVSFPTGRALPKKFFGGHVGVVVLEICNFEDEFVDFGAIVVHHACDFMDSKGKEGYLRGGKLTAAKRHA